MEPSSTNSNEIHTASKSNDDDEALMNGSSEKVQVIIPERWGQEGLLKDWMDYSSFDALLAPAEAALARQALLAQPPPRI
ncbi:hypothetical protein C2S53_014750 [Perilla frutescens var. hirtella]|uniref:Uncharacterized protein n=1 Tax=Perilla frutescens var. hirtella TaxID=608512 RepID=A0AAD4IMP4_PERFH|nr:hypothetical protein C2S53_014750 [Perilla frutescens var. hirtella]